MKIFHLSTCSTCKRILQEVNIPENALIQNVKENHISEKDLDQLAAIAGSYESLFNRRSVKYREWDMKNMELTESDYKRYILQEYSMLKRPIFWDGEYTFIGNSKKTIEALHSYLNKGI